MGLHNRVNRWLGRHQILLISAVLVVGNVALSTHRSSRVYLFEQAQCLVYYRLHDDIDESRCKIDEVQRPLSIVVGIDACLSLIPGNDTSL